MLQEFPGDSRIHRLRIVALKESDFNQSNRLAIGHPLLHALEDANDLPSMQYGSRPAKQYISAVLNKILQLEIHRNYKEPLAYIENDAVGCYERIMNPLILLTLCQFGVPQTVLWSLAATWAATSQKVKTIYGILDQSYTNSSDYFLYGPEQGSTIGPILWLLCFLLKYRSLSSSTVGMEFSSVDRTIHAKSKGAAFVDDTGLGCNVSPQSYLDKVLGQQSHEARIVQNLQKLSQEWERLLYSTGGALNLSKCFWYLLSWRWSNGMPTIVTKEHDTHKLCFTSGADVDAVQKED